MKKCILFSIFVVVMMLSCTAKNSNITQYKAIDNNNNADTTITFYTFKNNKLYIDEVGNEGFAYPYAMEKRGRHSYLRFYDEVWESWYEYEIVRKPNGDMVIKCKEGDILLQKQKKIIDLGFD